MLSWARGGLCVHDLGRGIALGAAFDLVALLDAFSRPLTPEAAVRRMSRYRKESVLRGIRRLRSLGFLLPAEEARRRESRLAAWRGNVASALYHAASRDLPYVRGEAAIDRHLRTQVATRPRPARYKHYRGVAVVRLPGSGEGPSDAAALDRVLHTRRTVRDFSRRPVELPHLAAVVRGTWGETGWLDGGPLGRLTAKTSPSAGGLHPIECYVLAWNVRDLPPGLYHYDVRHDELRRLKAGDFRREAVRAAAGQRWVGDAAFVCVMTAAFARTLWKYADEVSYRTLWLDAGHLCQTFDLLATANGLGPFQTAAIADSFLEGLIGLDGVKEFPLYLCGAGVPRRRRQD